VYFVARTFRQLLKIGFVAILGLILAGWSFFGARTYLESHLQGFIVQAFDINSILQSNLAGRMSGSAEHLLTASIRVAFSLSFVTFAALGLVVLWKMRSRKGQNETMFNKPILLALLSTIILAGFFSYGGELFMRLYLFGLIPMVYLISKGAANKIVFVAVAIFMIAAAPTLHVVARYGNEVMDYVPSSEIRGVDYFYDKSTQGYVVGMFREAEYHNSYKYFYYDESFKYFPFGDASWKDSGFSLEGDSLVEPGWPEYVCMSYGDHALHDFLLQPQFFDDTIRNVSQSIFYDSIYSNPDFEVYYKTRP
jgi:hypothetical protein